MCRLMAFSSRNETTLPSFMGSAFQEFVALSKVHHDSWGLALSGGGTASVIKKVETAAHSSNFQETINSEQSRGGLLHFRWASPGLPVTDTNAHPFTFEDIAFIHNGALSPYDAVKSLVAPKFASLQKGNTDSEQFFLYLLTEIDNSGFVEGVKKAMKNIKENFKYSSINSMIINSEYLIVTSEHDPANKPEWADEIYYELRYRLDDSGIAVASSGWNQEGWTLMKNHQMLIVNRKSLQTELIEL
jgi:predicted glutamine amidotransferase